MSYSCKTRWHSYLYFADEETSLIKVKPMGLKMPMGCGVSLVPELCSTKQAVNVHSHPTELLLRLPTQPTAPDREAGAGQSCWGETGMAGTVICPGNLEGLWDCTCSPPISAATRAAGTPSEQFLCPICSLPPSAN